MTRKKSAKRSRPVFVNAGSGPPGKTRIPTLFGEWRQIRVDVEPGVEPDLLASVTDLSAIADGSVNAVWSSHCIEHLFPHEVPMALAEFRRVLSADGFACIVVPDVQAIAHWISTDRLQEAIYESPAGPVTAHDMLWGFAPAIAEGRTAMAHHCGFTPTVLLRRLEDAGFAEILLRRKSTLELVALALPLLRGADVRAKLMSELEL
jgi:hypothetical protein